MNQAQKDNIGRIVLEIIENEYHNNLSEIVGMSVGITEKIPEQANNEIRNALNHLARAYVADDIQSADKNISQARGHLERASRDCLKIAVIHKRLLIENIVYVVEHKQGLLPSPVRTKLKNIILERDRILTSEARGGDYITRDLYNLVNNCNELHEFLLDNYTIPGARSHKISVWLRFLRNSIPNIFSGFTVGVLSGLVASVIFAYWFTDSASVRAFLNNYFGIPM